MLTLEQPPLESDTNPEGQGTPLQALFTTLNTAIAEQARAEEYYAIDAYRERNPDDAYGAAYQLCLGERRLAQRAVERARKAIVDYVFDADRLRYDDSLPILKAAGVETPLLSEKALLEKIGLVDGARAQVGQKVLDVVGVPRVALMQVGDLRVVPAVVYATTDPTSKDKNQTPRVHVDRVTEEGEFMLPGRGIVGATSVMTDDHVESQ